jgi:hypothetical protein
LFRRPRYFMVLTKQESCQYLWFRAPLQIGVTELGVGVRGLQRQAAPFNYEISSSSSQLHITTTELEVKGGLG